MARFRTMALLACAPLFGQQYAISTVAGNGVAGAFLNNPTSVAVDSAGDVYASDWSGFIRKIWIKDRASTIVAGTGILGYDGDGGQATNARFGKAISLALDSAGNIYFADGDNNRIRRIEAATGIIATVAGTGAGTDSGDGGSALNAGVARPTGISVDSAGDLYFSSSWSRVRKVAATTGMIETVAGQFVTSFGGDGGLATNALFWDPIPSAVNSAGDIYITDFENSRVRMVNAKTGIVNTVAGSGACPIGVPGLNVTVCQEGFSGDGGPANDAVLNHTQGAALDSAGNLFIADTLNHRIRLVDASTQIIRTIAGTGVSGFSGDGGAALSAEITFPVGIAVDRSGQIYFADESNQRIRVLSPVAHPMDQYRQRTAEKKGNESPLRAYWSDMTPNQVPRKPLRLWPGVVAVALQWLVRFGVPIVWPDALEFCVFAGVTGGVAVIVWWVFFSRAPRFDRWGAVVLLIIALGATPRILHTSIATGMMGMMFPVYAIPVVSLAFVVWAVASQRLSDGLRRATMVVAILLAFGAWALLRTDGITGDAVSLFAWRWSPTAEERLLAHASDFGPPIPSAPTEEKAPAKPGDEATVIPAPPAVAAIKADWPGFRGPRRDGSVPGLRIDTDWAASPPVELWRRPIGPGWSSFAVHNGLLYTQEQRGSDEVVACYNVTTGEPVWSHHDAARFWESNGGAGPRATPTLSNGRVYTFGATGIVNALDALTGKVLWSRNAASDTGVKIPEWGFASSPLVVGGVVIVAAAGELIAYDLATGEQRWAGPNGRYGYSSPHPLTIDGVEQVLLLSGPGVTSVSPIDGTRLWEYPLPPLSRITQPALTEDGDILVGEGEGNEVRRIAVTHGPAGWAVEERWKSGGLKPYFNDMVVHHGYAFGFDGGILACIDVKDGKRKWKGGRYGHGQLVLLPDQDLLLVLSEEGELALVSATPVQFTELARFPAIEGKTWNHPVLAGDVLLVRNGQEMVAFRLSLAHH